MITQSYIKSIFTYANGHLYWNKQRGKCKSGTIAGSKSVHGYWEIRLDNKLYKAHRLIWLYHHGSMPHKHLDHINQNKLDNRIENLRECNDSENGQNVGIKANNKSGLVGVSWHGASNKWISKICINRKQIYLGTFDDKGAAYDAYLAAKKEYHIFNPTA